MGEKNQVRYINFAGESMNHVHRAVNGYPVIDPRIEDLTSDELVRRRDTFNLEVVPYMKFLYNYALRMSGHPYCADDLLQETLLLAFKYFHKSEKETNLRAWLLRIMRNCYINKYRKEKEEPMKVSFDDEQNYYSRTKYDAVDPLVLERRVYANVHDEDLVEALNSLINDYKTVVILCDLEGMTYEEIAESLNWSMSTVRRRLHRARKILQMKLVEYAKARGH